MRYRYISYKYSRRVNPDTALQNIWDSFGSWAVPSLSIWRPPTDVYETYDKLVVVMEIAGVREEDITVTLFSDLLVMEGVRSQTALPDAVMTACHQLGIKYGEFRSEVFLSVPVDQQSVSAEYTHGMLRITLSKLQ